MVLKNPAGIQLIHVTINNPICHDFTSAVLSSITSQAPIRL